MKNFKYYTAKGIGYDLPSLPELTGSEKQVAWANGIRNRILTGMMEKIVPEYFDQILSLIPEFCAMHANARYWIDNDRHPQNVIREFTSFAGERIQ